MKKGDLRKQEILTVAEQLFCRQGYDRTGIQDILTALQTSKGSFYHHFISKEALLEEMCRRRVLPLFQSAERAAAACSSPVGKLNAYLSGMIPLIDEKLSFLLMLLPIFRSQEGKAVRSAYCDALTAQFSQEVTRLIREGNESGELLCENPAVSADLCLTLINRLWVVICDRMILAESKGIETDLSEILALADSYRSAIEHMLVLPYGSLELIQIPMLRSLSEQIHNHWTE